MADLTNRQKAAAELMVAEPELTYGEVAKKLDISTKTLSRWRELEEFQDYMHYLCMKRFKDLEKLAILKLSQNVKNNNQKAIQFTLENLGYIATQKVEADLNASIEIDYGD